VIDILHICLHLIVCAAKARSRVDNAAMKSVQGAGEVSIRMSDLTEEEKKKEKQENVEDEKKKEKQEGVKIEMINDPRKHNAKEDGKQSLNSQMAKKVGPKDCIIVVGTTGLGKSTCINLYTGQNLPTGDSAQSVTSNIVTVTDEIHGPKAPMWVDTPGWSDSEGLSDQNTFKDMLRHLQKNRLNNVKAVLWFITPTPRMDAILQKQAEFIEQFTMEDDTTREKEAGLMWSNTVIVCKGKMAAELDMDAQGARMAARTQNIYCNLPAIRYSFATPEIVAGATTLLRKDSLRMLTKDEVREELEEVLGKLPPPVRVVFSNQRCCACGQVGDPRLMENKCHREKARGHTGKLVQRFTEKQGTVSLGAGGVGTAILLGATVAIGATVGGGLVAVPLVAIIPVMAPGLAIAGHRMLNSPAGTGTSCCGVKVEDMHWSCCGKREDEDGCIDLCDLCESPWGSGKPCVLIKHPDVPMENYQVHLKEHDLQADSIDDSGAD